MEIFELLQHPEMNRLGIEKKEIDQRKTMAGYNLFTISSTYSHLENFHSDIIASLLDPAGLHGERNKFLHLFIDYLHNSYNVEINKEDFLNSVVTREEGRIDILVKDGSSQQAIIIENKINNAPDRDNQLKDYHEYATIKKNYSVKSIIYLSKDGGKSAPYNNPDISRLTKNIPAFNNTTADLCKGWLTPCIAAARDNLDSFSVLVQYSKLLSHLANNNMENQIKESFYKFVNDHNALDTLKLISELTKSLPDYRAKMFNDRTPSHDPFGKKWPYYNNYWIFEKYSDEQGSYKLDVFFEPDGSANIVMWNESLRNDAGYETVRNKLQKIGLLDRFNAPSRYNGLAVHFAISDEYPTLEAVDDAVLLLVNDLFQKLNSLHKKA